MLSSILSVLGVKKKRSKATKMSDPAEVEAYVASLKVVELKDELKKRHLSYVGNKPALAQRLREDMLNALQQTSDGAAGDEGEDEEEEPEPAGEEEVRKGGVLLLLFVVGGLAAAYWRVLREGIMRGC
jgi:ribosomal protein L12E/L44/L45/RPP1/RPP2